LLSRKDDIAVCSKLLAQIQLHQQLASLQAAALQATCRKLQIQQDIASARQQLHEEQATARLVKLANWFAAPAAFSLIRLPTGILTGVWIRSSRENQMEWFKQSCGATTSLGHNLQPSSSLYDCAA